MADAPQWLTSLVDAVGDCTEIHCACGPIPHISQGWWILRGGQIVDSVCLDMVGVGHSAHTSPFPPDAAEMWFTSARCQGAYR